MNRRLVEATERLEARVGELERRLSRSQRNSSLPPSQDPPSAAPRPRGKGSGRKPGGQQGHEGRYRRLLPPERVDEIVEHWPERCGGRVRIRSSIWGIIGVALREGESLPPETERRMQAFAELVGLAVASAQAREELGASRMRIVEASDAERRRLERNLHDGAQQRLVALSIGLRRAQAMLRASPDETETLLEMLSDELGEALSELRELAQGIHPGCSRSAASGRRSKSWVRGRRQPSSLTSTCRNVCQSPWRRPLSRRSEALARRQARRRLPAVVRITCGYGRIIVDRRRRYRRRRSRRRFGATRTSSRIEALDGELLVDSTPGRGTVVRAELPVKSASFATIGVTRDRPSTSATWRIPGARLRAAAQLRGCGLRAAAIGSGRRTPRFRR